MHWLYTHIDHFGAPIGLILGLFAAITGLRMQQYRKAGHTPRPDRLMRAGGILFIVAATFLLGVMVVKATIGSAT